MRKTNARLVNDLAHRDHRITSLMQDVSAIREACDKLEAETKAWVGSVVFQSNGGPRPVDYVGPVSGQATSGQTIRLPVGSYVAKRASIPNGFVAEKPDGVPFTVEAGKTIEVPVLTVEVKPTQPTKPTEPTKPTKPAEPAEPTTPPVIEVGVTRPVKIESGKTYDGQGVTIDAAGQTAISLQGVRDVTVKNYKIVNANGIGVDVWQSSDVNIENIEILSGEPSHGAQVRQSQGVRVSGIVARIVSGYLVYGEDIKNVTAEDCILHTGSRNETGMRFMGLLRVLVIRNNRIRNWLYAPKCTALRVQGHGDNVLISGGVYEGLSILGPLGEGQGGQTENDPIKRRQYLDVALTNVRSENVVYSGGLGIMAGLQAQITGGRIIGAAGPAWMDGTVEKRVNPGACPIFKIGWRYPDKEHYRDGDPVRPAPVGAFRGVAFTSGDQNAKTLGYGTNGPMKVIECTLNARSIGAFPGSTINGKPI